MINRSNKNVFKVLQKQVSSLGFTYLTRTLLVPITNLAPQIMNNGYQFSPQKYQTESEETMYLKGYGGSLSKIVAGILLSSFYLFSLYEGKQNISCSSQNKIQGHQLSEQRKYIEQQNNPHHRLHFLTDAQHIKNLSLRGKTIIWYQMCGIKHIDDQVIDMLIAYDQKYSQDMIYTEHYQKEANFKIIIDATNIESMQQGFKTVGKNINSDDGVVRKPVEIVILKGSDITPVQLSKHLSYKYNRQFDRAKGGKNMRYNQLFQRVNDFVKDFQELNLNNLREFVNKLGDRSYQGCILMAAPYSGNDSQGNDISKLKNANKKLASFVKSKKMFTSYCEKGVLVTDEQTLSFLGISDYEKENGFGDNIYLIVADSQNVVSPGKKVNIEGRMFNVYKIGGPTPENIQKSLIFPVFLEKSQGDAQFLRFNVDMNQNVSQTLKNLYQTLRKQMKQNPESIVSSSPKVLSFQNVKNKGSSQSLEIFLEVSNFDKIVNVYSEGCHYKEEQKIRLLTESYRKKFQYINEDIIPEQISAKDIQKWMKKLNEMSPSEKSKLGHFETERKSQNEKKIKKYHSEKITGQEYPYIIRGTHNKVGASQEQVHDDKCRIVFHYSEHCYSCSKFKHIYQEIAGEKKQQAEFYRIDNDRNKMGQGMRNYNSTPVFVLYRNGIPFYFKNTFFTKKIFEDFIEITKSMNVLSEKILDRTIQQRNETQNLVKQLFQS